MRGVVAGPVETSQAKIFCHYKISCAEYIDVALRRDTLSALTGYNREEEKTEMRTQVVKYESGNAPVIVAEFATLTEARRYAAAANRAALDDEERSLGQQRMGHYALTAAIKTMRENPRIEFVPEIA